MIFVTTFILTLILSYVARAVPACGDAAPPEELYRDEAEYYEPYEVTFDAQSIIPEPVWWDTKYDNPNGNTHNVTCSNLDPRRLIRRQTGPRLRQVLEVDLPKEQEVDFFPRRRPHPQRFQDWKEGLHTPYRWNGGAGAGTGHNGSP